LVGWNPGVAFGVQEDRQVVVNRAAPESDPSDAELVRQARRGDSAAFGALVTRYQDRVHNLCYRMCHNEADALDLSQSTFLKALDGLGRFRAESSFYTWLFRIAVNVTLSHRRAHRRRRTFSLDTGSDDANPGPQLAARQDDVAERAMTGETHAQVVRAIERLDEEFRIAVILKDVEDLGYAAISEILSVPVGTVKSRIHRGRLMLRELLTEERKPVDQP
jgi:RNA polymerase sigma-70 factor (ECF subfamily)